MPEEEIDMKRRMKGLLRIIFGRTTFAVLALSAQIGILVWCGLFFMEHIIYIFGLYILLGIAVVLHILNKKESPEYKISWVIPVLALPAGKEVEDHVILHELAHLYEPSHNARFKAFLDLHMPGWREIRKRMR